MLEISNYTIEKELGRGGMATVYLAVQDMLNRHVALKVMLPDMARDENFRKSFLSEGTIIASLEHPNIVRIHDIGVIDDSVLYMAMEYLAGGTLKERIGQGKLSFAESTRILQEVSQGLAYAHEKGYIHRDIKPGNILFKDNGTAVLTDFGIAKLQDTSGELTRLGFTMGTVQYMSPEQVITTELDQRSDIYSLGLVFYEMLTGLKAFKAESTVQAIHQHTTVPPPQLPNEYAFLQNTMDRVLAKEPENRFQTIGEFVRAVNEADDADKTVIHRVANTSQNPVDDDKTQVFKPINTAEETKEKRGFGLLAGTLGGILLIGLITVGVLNYPEIFNQFKLGELISDKEQHLEDERLTQDPSQQDIEFKQQQRILEEQKAQAESENQQKILEEQTKQAEIDKQKEEKKLQGELEHKKQLEAERLYRERLDRIKAEKQEKDQQEALEKQRAEKAEKERLEALEQKRIEEEQELQAELERQRKQNEQERLETLEQKKVEEAQELEAKVERERELENKQKLQAEREKSQQQARERKQAEEKALAKKRAEEAARKKKELARKKAEEAERKKKEIARERANERKRKAAELAKKKAEAERKRRQQANARGQIRVSATLNRKPYKTSFIVTKNGKRVQTISGRSSANFSLPPGRYTVTTQYGGKVSRAVVNIGAYEIAEQRFAFRGSAPAPRPPQQRTPINSKWTHTHEPAAQQRSKPIQKPQPKPQVKKESAADKMVREVDELWFQ